MVCEVKKYLPIHFNSHIKNYNVINKELERKINKHHILSESNVIAPTITVFSKHILNTNKKYQPCKTLNSFISSSTSSNILKTKYNNSKRIKTMNNLSRNDINNNNDTDNISLVRNDKQIKQEKPKVFVSRILTN